MVAAPDDPSVVSAPRPGGGARLQSVARAACCLEGRRGAAPEIPGSIRLAKQLIIAEKPSVAADIARALGGFTKHADYFESDRYVLSSAVGHLLESDGVVFERVTQEQQPVSEAERPCRRDLADGEVPGVLDLFVNHQEATYPLYVSGAEDGDDNLMRFDPREFMACELPPLKRPKFLAIIASSAAPVSSPF